MKPVPSNAALRPGLVVLHGNRLEQLRAVIVDRLVRDPLGPLDEEVFLVQSNAAADWLKQSLVQEMGLCAAIRFELPGRFLWRMYRRLLGPQVAERSSVDRMALTWRLMKTLPPLLTREAFEPVRRFLSDQDPQRALQLATRLADLYDQYQVYRGDWLAAWEQGRRVTISSSGMQRPLPDDQRWQADLWRALMSEFGAAEPWASRPDVHRAFLQAIAEGRPPAEPLPRRVILFGASHVSVQGLEALNALSARVQVICAIPNPCRYHWADIAEGREAQAEARQRMPTRAAPLADVPLAAMHLHAHPLLAAWGRQGRDFMRLLDTFDATLERANGFSRLEVFDDDPGTTLLQQVQAAIRDLVPLIDQPPMCVPSDDHSIVFDIAHSAQREVEILHDRLLGRLASGELRPRDIVVMVPDIEVFAPAIRAVFGQYDDDDARAIPFSIADTGPRDSDALIAGVEWLLRLPDQRMRLREVRDLLEIPAVAARAGIAATAIPGLFDWLADAGVRWGLDQHHRARLGLGAAGSQNSWSFGMSRMLLGYASGAQSGVRAGGASFAGIEPYDEIGGLETEVVGSLCAFLERLERWLANITTAATPAEWGVRGRAMLEAFFAPTDERERLTLAALRDALGTWLDACAAAGFDERVPLPVVRESWSTGVDSVEARRRFLGGGVTFCTLMPLRAVPFEIVCLLGMNDGDFPRAQERNDFDLMAFPGQQRPGDRSRREDDRYLMLEALLSARSALHVSWRGRSVRDNSPQPPSVLVAQLRDYLQLGWQAADGGDLLSQLTSDHPLQPFSRRYFDGSGLVTYAREWQAAHRRSPVANHVARMPTDADVASDTSLTIEDLEQFLRNPVPAFFARRLAIFGTRPVDSIDDDESFSLDPLAAHLLCADLLVDPDAVLTDDVDVVVARRMQRLRATGALPLFELGTRVAADAAASARLVLVRWAACRRVFPEKADRIALHVSHGGRDVDASLDSVFTDGHRCVWMVTTASRLLDKKTIRPHLLLRAWLQSVVSSAAGRPVPGLLIGRDTVLSITPPSMDEATHALDALLRAFAEGMEGPLPFTAKTGLAWLRNEHAARAQYDGDHLRPVGEGARFELRRAFPDFDRLKKDGRFERLTTELAVPIVRWIEQSVIVDAAMTGITS